ncbi:MAG: hypothetical protein K2I48_03955, partial [Muribaculaceae bacterium]|nr:hypothetical protein [Muribaculaceae bacterium]
ADMRILIKFAVHVIANVRKRRALLNGHEQIQSMPGRPSRRGRGSAIDVATLSLLQSYKLF